MSPDSAETDLRRRNLRTQLAAILQVDAGIGENRGNRHDDLPVADASAAKASGQGSSAAEGRPPGAMPSHAGGEPSAEAFGGRAEFVPIAPNDFSELRLAEAEVESLVLKFLLNCQNATGREIARQIGIAFCLCDKMLYALKTERLVVFKATASLGDYVYELTDAGMQRARKFAETCGYFGAAPVCLDDYANSVAAQSLKNCQPTIADLRRALADLTLDEDAFERLGRAIISGKELFLHGPPGNGKTSIAQRVTLAYGECIWVPRAISAGARSSVFSIPVVTRNNRSPKGMGPSRKRRSITAGSAFAGRRSSPVENWCSTTWRSQPIRKRGSPSRHCN